MLFRNKDGSWSSSDQYKMQYQTSDGKWYNTVMQNFGINIDNNYIIITFKLKSFNLKN